MQKSNDPCIDVIRSIVLAAGRAIRKASGLPEEKNLTKLLYETYAILGTNPLPPKISSSDDDVTMRMRKRKCPQCGEETLFMHSLAKDAKTSLWLCARCSYREVSEKSVSEWMKELHVASDISKKHIDPKSIDNQQLNLPPRAVRVCPGCGEKSFSLMAICRSCKESEEGKYRTRWLCSKCGHSEKSEKPIVTWLDELGIDFITQTKKSLGIDTVTDEGLK